MKEDIVTRISKLVKNEEIVFFRDEFSVIYVGITIDESRYEIEALESEKFKNVIQRYFYEKEGVFIESFDLQKVIDVFKMYSYDSTIGITTAKRIYRQDDKIFYLLNKDTGEGIEISNGTVKYEYVPENIYFKSTSDTGNQVQPVLDVPSSKLMNYVTKHFKVQHNRDARLLAMYIVVAFMGLDINHPVLIFTGERGASKSTSLKKIEKLVDPKISEIGSMPKGNDGLELKLANNYFVSLDNLSAISRSISDTLCRAVTGGSVSKRKLYKDTEEVNLNIKAIVAMNGISLIAKEADLLDRSLIIELGRIEPHQMKTEADLWSDFEKDRPEFLGAIFNTLAVAMNDKSPIKTKELIRMADYHIACIRVGKVLGFTEEGVSKLLWYNQKNANEKSLEEDVVAVCMIELVNRLREANKKNNTRMMYQNSVSELLKDLLSVAQENGISTSLFPKSPNHLSKRLNKIKSNLENEAGIEYIIVNSGPFKRITISYIK